MLVALPIRRIRLLLAEVSYAEVMQGRLRAPVFRRAAPRSSFFGVAPPRPPFADVRRRDRAPEPLHLVDPGVGDVLRAPVAADRQAPRYLFAEASEGMADALANGLERRPAIAELRRVPADDFVEMVINRAEEPAPAVLFGVEAGRIGAPHHLRPVGDDRPCVGGVAIGRPQPAGGQQPVGPHQPEHALPTDRAAP